MLQALRDEVIVIPHYVERKSSILIPSYAPKFKQYDGQVYGTVVSVGPRHKLGVKSGDKINWTRNEGKKIIHDGRIYFAVRECWIMGVVGNDAVRDVN